MSRKTLHSPSIERNLNYRYTMMSPKALHSSSVEHELNYRYTVMSRKTLHSSTPLITSYSEETGRMADLRGGVGGRGLGQGRGRRRRRRGRLLLQTAQERRLLGGVFGPAGGVLFGRRLAALVLRR